jgi:hypothetical protein
MTVSGIVGQLDGLEHDFPASTGACTIPVP